MGKMIAEFKEMKKLIILGQLFPLCTYCGKQITNPDDFTQDHQLPLARGGQTVPSNLVPACMHCNQEKGMLTADEYMVVLNYRKSKQQQN